MAEFETSVRVGCPIDRAYDFLLLPANVARISPPDVGLKILVAPEVVEVGSQVEFQVQAYGQIQRFVHSITILERPRRIVEEQVQGLFRKWTHEHVLEARDDGTTEIIDRIAFDPPTGLIGLLLTKKRILDQLEDAYYHRQKQLQKLLGRVG